MSSVIFVILGIGILGVSFVVALVSLVREEKQNGQILEAQAKSVPENPEGAAALQSVNMPVSGGGQIDDLAAKVAIEEKKQEELSVQAPAAQPEPQPQEQKEERQPFPWEDNSSQSQSPVTPIVVAGDNVLEDVKMDTAPVEEEIIPSVHRFPSLSQKPVGEVKLSDLTNKDDV